MLLCGQISMWSSTAPAAALTDSVRGHLRSLKGVPFAKLCMVSRYCPIVTLSVKRTVFEIFDHETLVMVTQGHLNRYISIRHL